MTKLEKLEDWIVKTYGEYDHTTGATNFPGPIESILDTIDELKSSSDEVQENAALCPTCGTPCKIELGGLDLVENSGDETLATKRYVPVKSKSDWITDRFPEKEDVYLVTYLGEVSEADWNGEYWYWSTSQNINPVYKILPWQPLPEAYKPENK